MRADALTVARRTPGHGLRRGLAVVAFGAIAIGPAAQDQPPCRERFEAATNEATTSEASPRKAVKQDSLGEPKLAAPASAEDLLPCRELFEVATNEAATSEASPRKAVEQDSARERKPSAPASREPIYTIDAHVQFGRFSQTARDSFDAILGSSSGQVFGAGAELTLRSGFFVRADMSYFRDEGERVEMVDGEIVPLGIPLTLSLTPIEFSGGYRLSAFRFGRRGQVTLVPFVGAGAGVVRFSEQTDDEHPDEQASERFTSYHLLIGLDVPISRRVAIGGELTRRWVRDGLGSGGISEAFGETDLGGTTMWTRVRVIF